MKQEAFTASRRKSAPPAALQSQVQLDQLYFSVVYRVPSGIRSAAYPAPPHLGKASHTASLPAARRACYSFRAYRLRIHPRIERQSSISPLFWRSCKYAVTFRRSVGS